MAKIAGFVNCFLSGGNLSFHHQHFLFIVRSSPMLLVVHKGEVNLCCFESRFVAVPSNCYGSNKSSNSDGSKMSCVSIICDNIRWDKPRKQQMQCCRVLINFLNLGVLHPSWPRSLNCYSLSHQLPVTAV